ncbi:MAG: hypothetical protein AAF907_01170, partial [Planctomycetota bacterium]
SLAGTIARLTSDPPADCPDRTPVTLWRASPGAIRAITLGAAALAVGWLAWCGGRPRDRNRPAVPFEFLEADGELTAGLRMLCELSLVLCGMLLLSPMSSTQHFVFLLPGLAAIAARLIQTPNDRWNGLAAAGLFVLGTLPAKDLIGDHAAEMVRSAGGHTACTVIVLWASGRLLVRDRNESRRATDFVQ